VRDGGPIVLPESEVEAIRRHAKLVEDFNAARAQEFRRLLEPYREGFERVADSLGLIYREMDAHTIVLLDGVNHDPAVAAEMLSWRTAINAGMRAFHRSHGRNFEPNDTPDRVVQLVDAKYESWERMSSISPREYVVRSGCPPTCPPDVAKAAYREVRNRALAFASVAPSIAFAFPAQEDPFHGLMEIRATFVAIGAMPGPDALGGTAREPVRIVERFGPVELDADRRTAYLDGVAQRLTKREYESLLGVVKARHDGIWAADLIDKTGVPSAKDRLADIRKKYGKRWTEAIEQNPWRIKHGFSMKRA
jgi:hypothetical protein